MAEGSDDVRGSFDSAVIGERFGIGRPPTALARTASVAPIGFTRLTQTGAITTRAKDVPPEEAFSVHVALRPTPVALWREGRPLLSTRATPGDTFLFDLRRNPVSECRGPFDILRFYISQTSLDDLCRDEGARGSVSFATPPLGVQDRVLHGLSNALLHYVERPDECCTLFIDHLALAFHAHITETYGTFRGPSTWPRGTLAPWQLRRALDYLLARLGADPSVADVARECGLSAGYFARAFRQTTGVTPHQWLIRRRVERARLLLLRENLPLADIAIACGFNDQSHFTRVFGRTEGRSPGAWRLAHRGSVPRSVF